MPDSVGILPAGSVAFDASAEVLVIGAGACGLVAALAAAGAGAEVVVLEGDARPTGSTAMSSGFVPAADTRFQRAQGTDDAPALFASDIQAKAHGEADPAIVDLVSREIGPALEWLATEHGLEWQVLDGFLYPGHSRHRMHAVPGMTGAALQNHLLEAAERAGATIATQARVTALVVNEAGAIEGVVINRPDGAVEAMACHALILACGGFGGDGVQVAKHIPDMATAPYYGHPGNRGDAVAWGEALGASTACMSACQGHGSLAEPHGILITWALMMEGGIQVNMLGKRFSNEHAGYSEQAVSVLAQPGGIAWNIYDRRLHGMAAGFPDYRLAMEAGAIRTGDDVEALAASVHIPVPALAQTLASLDTYRKNGGDPFGRDFAKTPKLSAPFHAVKVTSALFHTQGGLRVDGAARVLRADGNPLPNLFAGGGAACGVSGKQISGYLSGNGLLTAIALGAVAGREAGQSVRLERST